MPAYFCNKHRIIFKSSRRFRPVCPSCNRNSAHIVKIGNFTGKGMRLRDELDEYLGNNVKGYARGTGTAGWHTCIGELIRLSTEGLLKQDDNGELAELKAINKRAIANDNERAGLQE